MVPGTLSSNTQASCTGCSAKTAAVAPRRKGRMRRWSVALKFGISRNLAPVLWAVSEKSSIFGTFDSRAREVLSPEHLIVRQQVRKIVTARDTSPRGAAVPLYMAPARGAKVLQFFEGPIPEVDAEIYDYLCGMNLENYLHVPTAKRSEELFRRMLRSPWNAPAASAARIPPLVLQLGANADRDDDARVLEAVKHSGYNFQFASERLRADVNLLAWAAATEEVKSITLEDAIEIEMYCQMVLNKPNPIARAPMGRGGVTQYSTQQVPPIVPPNQHVFTQYSTQQVPYSPLGAGARGPVQAPRIPYDEWREKCKLELAATIRELPLITTSRSTAFECKGGVYFIVPKSVRERLWPWRQRHVRILAELQGQGKMPAPPADDERMYLRGDSARDNFTEALGPVFLETYPELSGEHKCRMSIIYGIWSELSVDDQAQWALAPYAATSPCHRRQARDRRSASGRGF